MKIGHLILAVVAAGALGSVGYGLYRAGLNQGMKSAAPVASAPSPSAGGVDPSTGRKVLYWHDPMVPGQKFDRPGKSPYMDMQLVPVYADGEDGGGSVAISPRLQQNLGIRTTEAIRGTLSARFEAVGNVAYNERDVALVQARSNGFVEKLYVRAPLDSVRKGQPLAELYVPEWVAAQEEYLSARRMTGSRLEVLIDGARQRMALAGMTEDQIRLVESTGEVHARLTVSAPIGGVITELGAREGMTVMAGATLFRVNGLDVVWVNAEVPEALADRVRPGAPVEARASALPGTLFKGRVSAILPEVDLATRTLKARVELANPKGQLVPGMFATLDLASAAAREAVLVPTEAVIQTGTRSVVIVVQDDGRFAPVDVEVGMESGGRSEIRKGLEAGRKVVVSGQFLIDSEASLKGSAARMGDAAPEGPGKPAIVSHRGEGTIERIGEDEITLSHGPIPSLQWGAMTMGFRVRDPLLLSNLKPGQKVEFEFSEAEGDFVVSRITLAGGAEK